MLYERTRGVKVWNCFLYFILFKNLKISFSVLDVLSMPASYSNPTVRWERESRERERELLPEDEAEKREP